MAHQPVGVPCNCDQRGWMPGVEHVPVRWARPEVIQREQGLMEPHVIVDHIMVGWLTTMVNWALSQNPERRIIAHFGIARNGRVVQFSDIYTEGVHASTVSNPTAPRVRQIGSVASRGVNPYSIGIEHEGFSVPLSANDPPVIKAATWSRDNPWPESMARASIKAKRWIFAQPDHHLDAPSRDSIIGHYETGDPTRVNDPAAATDRSVWPVARMIRELDPAALPDAYTVKERDTLGAIALRFGVAMEDLQRWNGITDADHLVIGQVLRFAMPKMNDEGPGPDASKQRALLEIQRAELKFADGLEHLRRAKQALGQS